MDANVAAAIITGLLALIGLLGTAVLVAIRRNGEGKTKSEKTIDDPRHILTGDLTVEYLEERLRDLFMPPILNGLNRGSLIVEYQEETLRMLADIKEKLGATGEVQAVATLITEYRRRYKQ